MDTDTLREMFVYECNGMLRRIVGGRKDYPWRKVGRGGKYLVITVGGETLYLHRLIWQYHHGRIPTNIDHINGDTSDNRIENLRECSNAENQYNSRVKSNNKCGFKGVVLHKKCRYKKWQAKIVVNSKVISLGYYKTPEEAAEAYRIGAEKYAKEFAFHLRQNV